MTKLLSDEGEGGGIANSAGHLLRYPDLQDTRNPKLKTRNN